LKYYNKQNETKIMKKHLLILSFAALTLATRVTNAQIINSGFETWTADALASSTNDPNTGNGSTGWWDYNMLNSSFVGSSPVSVFKNTDTVHSGTYSALIESVPLSATSWGYVKAYGILDTMGMIITGNVTMSTSVSFKTGEPFTQKITSLSFYYQYAPKGTDSAIAEVVLYKFNTVSKTRTVVAAGTWGTPNSTAGKGWQQATVNMTYADTLTPDTILVILSATSVTHKPKAGSKLYVDDVTTTAPTGINPLSAVENSVTVYPNPASTEINFVVVGENKGATITIFDITGQKVATQLLHNNFATVNTQPLSAGLYIYQVADDNGNLIKAGKFSIVK
jgi:hypothetical protein